MAVERKLTTLLAADLAGYSRLMGVDEEGTLHRFKSHRAICDTLIAQHRGRVFGGAGDSVLAEFASPVAAVRCAVAIQSELAAGEAGLPEERRMRFRIGVNLGDVMVEGDNLFGDGVNVAARLEALAEAGGICISGSVYDQVETKLDLAFESLGEHALKNIARPVRIYRIRLADAEAAAMAESAKASEPPPPLPAKPSIAVLPFENMSGDPEQGYFSDGIAEDIITDLSKLSGLFVIARNSAFTYRGKAVRVQDVGRELGVRYVLEGSVRKAGGRVRITAQLVDAASGHHLWAERYDRDLTDIFAVQDEVREKIVSVLAVRLTGDERHRLQGRGTAIPEAYDYFLRGRDQVRRHTREDTALAQALFRQAITFDPEFAAAYAELSYAYQLEYGNRWTDQPDRALQQAYEFAKKAIEVDAAEPTGHWALGVALSWMKQHDAALAEAERALELDPNFANARALLGNRLHYAGQSERAIEHLKTAIRLDPHMDLYLHFLGQAYFMLGRYDDAVAVLKRRLIRKPDSDVSRVLLASCYGHLGRFDEARAEWAEALRINPGYSLESKRRILPYKDPADFDRIVEGLRKAGLSV